MGRAHVPRVVRGLKIMVWSSRGSLQKTWKLVRRLEVEDEVGVGRSEIERVTRARVMNGGECQR